MSEYHYFYHVYDTSVPDLVAELTIGRSSNTCLLCTNLVCIYDSSVTIFSPLLAFGMWAIGVNSFNQSLE